MSSPQSTYLQEIDLRTLSEMEGAERAFLSLYLSDSNALNMLSQRAERVRTLLSKEPAELEQFEENMRLAKEWLNANSVGKSSLCLFVCWALDFAQGIPVPVELPDLLRVGATPYIRPLAEIQDEYENFLVVLCDNDATRILQVTSAVAETADRISGDIPNHVRKGGWSQQRYSRRRDKELLHYAKEINDVLAELVRDGEFERIVLLGAKETLAELASQLEPSVSERVIAKERVDLHADEKQLVETAYQLFFREERDEEDRLWDRIKAAYLADGLAELGATAVLDMLHLGRVEELLLTRDAEIAGTRCRACENVVHGSPDSCQICGSSDVFPIDLVDELVRQAELTGADVEFSDPIAGLTEAGDVAALLRY